MGNLKQVFFYLMCIGSLSLAAAEKVTFAYDENGILVSQEYFENGVLRQRDDLNYFSEEVNIIPDFEDPQFKIIEAMSAKKRAQKEDSSLDADSCLTSNRIFENPCIHIKARQEIKSYYLSKKIKSIYSCEDEMLEGSYRSYYESGALLFKHQYHKGHFSLK